MAAVTTWSERGFLVRKALGFVVPLMGRLARQRILTTFHGLTWRDTPNAMNVVVIGGSFAGMELVKQLADALPTGFKLVWIEKNSHLNYSFNFPRFSVMTGHEHEAFIPYEGWASGAPSGILTRIQDRAIAVTETHVRLASGKEIDYAYLVVATGSSQPLPVQVSATERAPACRELQSVQKIIKTSQKVAVLGGGAVGVELAGDIKDFYPDKDVTLVHSRDQLMNRFGKRLQDYTLKALRDELGVRVLLNERPQMLRGANLSTDTTLEFSNKHQERFDLVICCTGQRPNSSILNSFLPGAISKDTSRIIVSPALQVLDAEGKSLERPIFALGDVAEHGGPHMARAGWVQAGVVSDNILEMTNDRAPTHMYRPNFFLEGAIRLTLGKAHNVTYAHDNEGTDVMFSSRDGTLDLEVQKAWKMFGADFSKASHPVV